MEVPIKLPQPTPANDVSMFPITGFKVSAPYKLAIVLTASGNILVIDMQQKVCRPYDLTTWPVLSPRDLTLDMSPAGNEFVFIQEGKPRGIAICNINGQIRLFETDAPPTSVNWNKNNGLIQIGFDVWASTNGYFLIV